MRHWIALLLAACSSSPGGVPLQTCSVAAPVLYPAPRFETHAARGTPVRTVCIEGAPFDPKDLVAAAGLSLADANCDWTIAYGANPPALDSAAQAVWDAGNSERYLVATKLSAGRPTTTLAGSAHSLRMALATARGGCVGPTTIVDYPSFPTRGVVESFCNGIYTSDERVATMRLAERLRMNIWIYGPKSDPFTHLRWADPYPSAFGQPIANAAAEANAHAIDFYWAVSPGVLFWETAPGTSIQYSSDADFARLLAKIDNVRALGVRKFALFLDDLNESLVWPADQAAFSSLVEAQSFLITRLENALPDPLVIVGTRYTNAHPGWQDYIRGLHIDSRIQVFWTGPDIDSASIAASDLVEVDALLGRPVWIWDNAPWTVEPLRNRSADLPTAASAFLANPVLNENGAHPVGDFWAVLGPIADYAWNPSAYDPDASFATWQMIR